MSGRRACPNRWRWWSRVALVVGLLASTVACQIRTNVDVAVNAKGAGVVTVKVGLDRDATNRVADLKQLRLDDIRQAGWTVDEPKADEQGWTWFRAEKPFGSPEELQSVLTEVGGESGPFQDFSIRVTDGFARTTYELTGRLKLDGGLTQFSDSGVASALDGLPLGRDAAELKSELGDDPEAIQLSMSVKLPGRVTKSNSANGSDEHLQWTATVAEAKPVDQAISAKSEVGDRLPNTLLWVGAGLLAIALLVLLLGTLSFRRGRGQQKRAERRARSQPA